MPQTEPTNAELLKESIAKLTALLVDPAVNSLLIEQEMARASALADTL